MKVNDRQRVVILDGGHPVKLTCPKCRQRKVVDDFGLRNMGGGRVEIRNQSHCRACRIRAKKRP